MKKKTNLIPMIYIIGTFICMCGCSTSDSRDESKSMLPLPDFSAVLQNDMAVEIQEADQNAVIPVRIYVDNTGSMQGYARGSQETSGRSNKIKRCPDPNYTKLMRSLRDMSRMQESEYYVLSNQTDNPVPDQDWVLYDNSVYEEFSELDFYVGWYRRDMGPLALLYLEERLNPQDVNIVLTDLAEQHLNNTKLAERIQIMCEKEGCEAVMYAFQFSFFGPAQVPNPENVSGMIEKELDTEKKPYYLIMTGPARYMKKYRKELEGLFINAGLEEGDDYYSASTILSTNEVTAGLNDLIYMPVATYDDYKRADLKDKEGMEESENDLKEEDTEITTIPFERLSKNLERYGDDEKIFKNSIEDRSIAFQYVKTEGVSEREWLLNFYLPLNDSNNPDITYACEYKLYHLSEQQILEDSISGETGPKEERVWIEDADPRIQVEESVSEEYEGMEKDYPTAMFFSCKDYPVPKKHLPRETEILLVFRVIKEQRVKVERPDWLGKFDTSTSHSPDDYFLHTYNLIGFYDVLFGYRNKAQEDDFIHFTSTYAEIPVVLTNLPK